MASLSTYEFENTHERFYNQFLRNADIDLSQTTLFKTVQRTNELPHHRTKTYLAKRTEVDAKSFK